MPTKYVLRHWFIATGLILLPALAHESATAADHSPLIPVGVAKIDITPNEPIRLVGYGGRKTEAKSVASKIWAKALAFGGDEQKPSVLITAELIGVSASLVEEVAERLKKKTGLERANLAVCATHTHTGPAIAGMLLETHFGDKVPQAQKDRIERYTARLLDRLEQVALDALKNRQPSRLAWSEGSVGFAVNRRQIRNGLWVGMRPNRDGPVDHALPILTVTGADGKLRALFLNYACHCTTYGPGFNEIHGDWAGAAAQMIEKEHPGCVAMVALGCGGDANPEPRGVGGGFELVNRHGAAVANEVKRLLANKLTSLKTVPTCSLKRIDLPLDHVPNRAEWQKRLKGGRRAAFYAQLQLARLDRGEKIPASFSYPVQVWNFGDDLSMVFLAGEVVSGYSLRLKREAGDRHLWVNGYANDAPCYIATRKMILEGGYEVEESMNSYDKPTRLSVNVEDLIIEAVQSLLQ
jgi:Neutral/alkaline non-lysosomal ceramidase, N-terminal